MKFEFSAGGVVYKPVRSEQGKNTVEILLAKHSQHHGWVFPKGIIGDTIQGEKKEETAIREVEEETGVQAELLEPLKPVTYWYQFENEKRKKTVYYFIMSFISEDKESRDMEMEEVEWLPVEEVENTLTYPSDKQVWKEAKDKILNLLKN